MNTLNIEELKLSKPEYCSEERIIYSTKGLSIVDSQLIFSIQELNEKIIQIMNNVGHDYPHIYCMRGFHVDQELIKDGESENSQTKSCLRIYFERPGLSETLSAQIEKRLNVKSYYKFENLLEHSYVLLNCIAYLHSKKIHHNNISSSSIIFDYSGNLRLGYIKAFSLSPPHESEIKFPKIIPPEERQARIENNYFGDIWNLGILLLQLATLEKFDFNSLSHQNINQLLEDVKLTYPPEFADLIKNMIHFEPLKRWSAELGCLFIEEKIAPKYKIDLTKIVKYKHFEENNKVVHSFSY